MDSYMQQYDWEQVDQSAPRLWDYLPFFCGQSPENIGVYCSGGLLGLIGFLVGAAVFAGVGYFIGKWLWERV